MRLLLFLCLVVSSGLYAQTAVNLTRAINTVNALSAPFGTANVLIVPGKNTEVREDGTILLDFDRTGLFGEAGIAMFSTAIFTNIASPVQITATVDDQSRVKAINYGDRNWKFYYEDSGEIKSISLGTGTTYSLPEYEGDRLVSYNGGWGKNRKKGWTKKLTVFEYNPDGTVASITKHHIAGKGKEYNDIKPGKQKMESKTTYTADKTTGKLTTNQLQMNLSKNIVGSDQAWRVHFDGRKEIKEVRTNGRFAVDSETLYDDQWRVIQNKRFYQDKINGLTEYTYDDQNRMNYKKSNTYKNGELVSYKESNFKEVVKKDSRGKEERNWRPDLTTTYDKDGKVVNEIRDHKMRTKLPDGSWSAWRFLRY